MENCQIEICKPRALWIWRVYKQNLPLCLDAERICIALDKKCRGVHVPISSRTVWLGCTTNACQKMQNVLQPCETSVVLIFLLSDFKLDLQSFYSIISQDISEMAVYCEMDLFPARNYYVGNRRHYFASLPGAEYTSICLPWIVRNTSWFPCSCFFFLKVLHTCTWHDKSMTISLGRLLK